MSKEILNGQITSTKLGEEHGCLTAEIFLEGDGWSVSFGGYCLDHWFNDVGAYDSSDGYGAIIELMKTLEVDSWEQLKGQYVRVEFEGKWGGRALRIGHLTKNKWFSYDEYFAEVHRKHED